MFMDARSIPAGTRIEAELCIVGGGAAGIGMAREFANSGVRVALLESGGTDFDPDTQALYEGDETGRSYLDLTTCRLRYFGGTTNHWGGWCLPLDPIDFEEREGLPYRGWPFDRSQLDPFYRRAHEICQIGAYDYDPFHWDVKGDLVPPPFTGPHFICKMLQQSPPTRFGPVYGPMLRAAPNLGIYLNANLLRFETDPAGGTVQQASVATLGGGHFIVAAKIFVLAAGGIENARLLLASNGRRANGLGNDHDLVGRFFMVHLEYGSAVIALADPYAYLDFNRPYKPAAESPTRPFVGLSEETMRRRKLLNIRITWGYQMKPLPEGLGPLLELVGKERAKPGVSTTDNVLSVIRDLDELGSYGWNRIARHRGSPVDSVTLRCHSEQMPNPESRVTLAGERDALGVNRVALDWRLTETDKRLVNEIHTLLATEVGRTGFGRLRYFLGDDSTTWPDELRGNEHHMGTTRMHRDPRQGVVDEHCRVHGLDNLYIAGSSVFPTSGAANPTLTILALALRLSDHLKERFA